MTRNISVPAAHETALESVLKKHNIAYEKKEIKSSAIGLEKKDGNAVMFNCQVNETIAFELGYEVCDIINREGQKGSNLIT